MNITDKVASIQEMQAQIDARVKEVLSELKDTSVPLDERWEAFIKISEKVKLPIQSYGDGFVDYLGDNMTLYDDFYIERHQTVKYVDMAEQFDELETEISAENIAEWKEKVLQSGYGAFIHDW